MYTSTFQLFILTIAAFVFEAVIVVLSFLDSVFGRGS